MCRKQLYLIKSNITFRISFQELMLRILKKILIVINLTLTVTRLQESFKSPIQRVPRAVTWLTVYRAQQVFFFIYLYFYGI